MPCSAASAAAGPRLSPPSPVTTIASTPAEMKPSTPCSWRSASSWESKISALNPSSSARAWIELLRLAWYSVAIVAATMPIDTSSVPSSAASCSSVSSITSLVAAKSIVPPASDVGPTGVAGGSVVAVATDDVPAANTASAPATSRRLVVDDMGSPFPKAPPLDNADFGL